MSDKIDIVKVWTGFSADVINDEKFHWRILNEWFVVYFYMQIFGINFEFGDDSFERGFIGDPIQKKKFSTENVFQRARCFLAVSVWLSEKSFAVLDS